VGEFRFLLLFFKKEDFRGGFYFGSFSKRTGGREARAGSLGRENYFPIYL